MNRRWRRTNDTQGSRAPSTRRVASGGIAILLACACAATTLAGTTPADTTLTRIQQEARERSEVRDTLFRLTDAIGPRVVGSPAIRAAEAWLVERLRGYGLHEVRVERNAPADIGGGLTLDLPGWSWNRLTVQQLAPWPQTLIAMPALYSASTGGAVTGVVVVAPLPKPDEADVTAFVQRHRGRLRGTFLLLRDEEAGVTPSDVPAFGRHTDADLEAMTQPLPAVPAAPGRAEAAPPNAGTAPAQPSAPPSMAGVFAQYDRLFDVLRDEGVLALIRPAGGGSHAGLLRVGAPPTPPGLVTQPPPIVDLAPEHFNRLLRLRAQDVTVRLEVHLDSTFHEHTGTANVLAEIPAAGDRAHERVLIGAHLDSWHGGTGATDNAVGVATMLEAIRILTTLEVPLRRTVQVAFWGGEEFGLVGSRSYVKRHLLDADGAHTGAWRTLSCYLNLDYGSGRIRGIYLQGNEALRPLFTEWLKDIGDGTLVAARRTTLGSDQASFERVGIPGLSFVQDPLNYEQQTRHTNMDVSDYVLLDDVQDSAATLASVIYKVANAESLLPRRGD